MRSGMIEAYRTSNCTLYARPNYLPFKYLSQPPQPWEIYSVLSPPSLPVPLLRLTSLLLAGLLLHLPGRGELTTCNSALAS